VVEQEQDDMMHAEVKGLTSRNPDKTFEEMLVPIRESLSDLASYDNGDNGDDEDNEETEQGKVSIDDEPGWVRGTITKTVQQCMERFRQVQLMLDELTQPPWEHAPDYSRERDKEYRQSELRVRAVVQPRTNDDTPLYPPTTCAMVVESLDIVPGLAQGSSRPQSSHIRLRPVKPQSKSSISSGKPAAEPNSSPLLIVGDGSSFGPGGYYWSALQRPRHIKNRRFFKRTIT
jgi:hypothetical protein